MNNLRLGGSGADKQSITISNVGSLLGHILPAHPSSSILSLKVGWGGRLSFCPFAMWPQRKSPEYVNKGSGSLRAQLKLLYYRAPLEICGGRSGKAKHWGLSLYHSAVSAHCILGIMGYKEKWLYL